MSDVAALLPIQAKKSYKKVNALTSSISSTFLAQARNETQDLTPDEDSLLRDSVFQFGGKNWKAIAGRIEHRSPAECSKRWNTLQGLDTVVKRPWSAEEDMEMKHLVEKYGASKCSVIVWPDQFPINKARII
ncbi:hypothetical protein PsorP6_012858 [Peronosclerospora sorghi]|uniref:Uncharacterized protein n=1 Tax=Peronosclerospora sorghi TaxID=230839 RepID=A0ACC0WFA2_9STRA|nr:hypothetical protein PsorP6_012858 [Peronosclerospora sorghi]